MVHEAEKCGDSLANCRERRRHRIEMRRKAAELSSCSAASASRRRLDQDCCVVFGPWTKREADQETDVGADPRVLQTPVYGKVSVSGRSREMEDTVDVRIDLCRPGLTRRQPVHFFAVYDGHGGSHVSELCKEKMHRFVREELERENESESDSGSNNNSDDDFGGMEDKWRRVMKRSFERMDELVGMCTCGNSENLRCGCGATESVMGGSTAVVVVLMPKHIVVANCGDSRAVLSRTGRCVPLSIDHKPDRPDELARIEAAGGRVLYSDGARVEGVLAMSRAIGDKYLKPSVISEPEITITKRHPEEDECLILASDGLWDVVSSDLACRLAQQCLHEQETLQGSSSRSVLAATILTRLALGRRSSDNISVIVADLKQYVTDRHEECIFPNP